MVPYSWRDITEILFFSWVVYGISCWLAQDKTKPLLAYFYASIGLFCFAQLAQLSAVSNWLIMSAPAIATIFIIGHQKTLQQNLIALKSYHPAKEPTADWIDTLLRGCLIAINANKSVRFLIQNKDDLSSLLSIEYKLEATATTDTLSLLVTSTLTADRSFILFDQSGTIQGVNCGWKQPFSQEEETARIYSSKTDCLIIFIHPTTNTLTLFQHGKEYTNISVHQAANHLNQHLPSTQGTYANTSKNNHHQSPLS